MPLDRNRPPHRDRDLVTTSGGTDVCLMRVAVKRTARDGTAGHFDVKAFGNQAAACVEYLSAGREVGIEGRLRFKEFETQDGDYYASRVYIVADAVEFRGGRRDDEAQADASDEHDERPRGCGRGGHTP